MSAVERTCICTFAQRVDGDGCDGCNDPPPLTRKRARAVLAEYLTRADTPDALRLAICRVNDGPDECADALADLLVDAAAGRVR